MTLPRVVADSREEGSGVPERLRELGMKLEIRLLDVGDYVVGQHAIERKSTVDFISSLYSGRLFDQARRLREVYESAMLVVEGDQDELLTGLRNPRAYWGALLSMAQDYGIDIFFTLTPDQTAELIYVLAKRLVEEGTARPPLLAKRKRLMTMREWQLAIVEGLPGIGPQLADRLLRAFGNVRGIYKASAVELATKGGLGRARASKIASLLDAKYEVKGSRAQAILKLNET